MPDKILQFTAIIQILKKNIFLIFLTTIITTLIGCSYLFFLATPQYSSQTQVIAKVEAGDNNAALAGQVQANSQMSTTIAQVMTSQSVLQEVIKNLGLNKTVSELKAEMTPTTTSSSQVVTLTVKDTNPYIAARIANETATVFTKKASKLLNVSNIGILAVAYPNTTPMSPNKKKGIAISVIAGLVIGFLISFVKTLFNTKVTDESDLEFLGISQLGSISKL
ncbi:YveK family protein [Lactococcus lactis]|uniref:Capsular polysaccharide biosynthesis protein CpsC n=1 Tax=Lactococcus lactis TaxID=1358 RepID=A0AB35KEB7_9LACT|nr:Wzz/FepE/Etk N-terminal domain-containing protein [Lactococcus lactis]MDG5049590.1 Wzz/FepE/Etk N-terminal domain-containing protein [Lactococcus lactis]